MTFLQMQPCGASQLNLIGRDKTKHIAAKAQTQSIPLQKMVVNDCEMLTIMFPIEYITCEKSQVQLVDMIFFTDPYI